MNNKRKLVVLVGVSGSGKSYYARSQKELDPSIEILSSDTIREELFGSNPSYSKEESNKVFNEIHKRINESTTNTIYYDATNLRVKARKNIYNLFNKKFDVECIVFVKPFSSLREAVKGRASKGGMYISTVTTLSQLKSFTPPKVGVDCDSIKVFADTSGINTMVDELINGKALYHRSSYHLETVNEHIKRSINNAPTEHLKTVARFHDVGKFFTCEGGNFLGHANVSSYFALGSSEDLDKALEVSHDVANHMKEGNNFSSIDSASRTPIEPVIIAKPVTINGVRYRKSDITPSFETFAKTIKGIKYEDEENFREYLRLRNCLYSKEGKLLMLGLPKFFNLGGHLVVDKEDKTRESITGANSIRDKPLRVTAELPKDAIAYKKLDGTLILAALNSRDKDGITVVTRGINGGTDKLNKEGSISSMFDELNYSLEAKQIIKSKGLDKKFKPNRTYCFELIGSRNKLTVDYDVELDVKPILEVVHPTFKNGYTIDYIYNNSLVVDNPEEYLKEENNEGLVYYSPSERWFYKLKSPWYYANHFSVADGKNITRKDLRKAFAHNEIDDLIPKLSSQQKALVDKVIELIEIDQKDFDNVTRGLTLMELHNNPLYSEYSKKAPFFSGTKRRLEPFYKNYINKATLLLRD